MLVNNAGIATFDDTYTLKIDEFNRLFETNVISVITMTQLCVPHLEKTKGNIVNVSSICGSKSVKNLTSFGMTKAALDSFTKSAALDLSSKGIRCNSISCAMIRTPILETMEHTAEQAAKIYDCEGKRYLVGRVGEVSDTTAAITYLAAESSSFINGISIPVSLICLTDGLQKQFHYFNMAFCFLSHSFISILRLMAECQLELLHKYNQIAYKLVFFSDEIWSLHYVWESALLEK